MADKIAMSLDEIISKNKSKFSLRGRGRGGSRGRGRGGSLNRGRGGSFNRGGRGGSFNRGGRGGSFNRGARSPSRGRGGGRGGIGGGVRGRGMGGGARGRGVIGGGARGRGGMRGGLRGRSVSTSRPANKGGQAMYYGAAQVNGAGGSGKAKLTIGNLFYGVSDSDIKELFREFGKIINSAVHYDKSGRSLGTAHVLFEKRSDAVRAMNHYHNIDLDNRPMKISIEGEAKPVAPVKSPVRGARRGARGLKRLGRGGPSNSMGRGAGGRGVRRGRGGRGARRGGRGLRRGSGPKKMPTAEQLDAELEAYSVQATK